MFKKYLVLSIIVLAFNAAGVRLVFAQTQDDKNAKLTQEIKTKVAKIGIGEKSKVKVVLQNQTKIKGYITAIDDDSFTVTDKKTGATTKIEYAQAKKVSRDKGFSTAATIGIIAGVAAAAILTIFAIGVCSDVSC